jgi:hypothetical protein
MTLDQKMLGQKPFVMGRAQEIGNVSAASTSTGARTPATRVYLLVPTRYTPKATTSVPKIL